MATITVERAYEAPADVVWAVVTDHELYGEVAPNLASVEVVEGDGEGMVRRCVDTDGNEWTESCHDWTEGETFAVGVDVPNSDFHRRLFDRFEGRWTVTGRGEDVLVTMTFDYDTRWGPLGWLVSAFLSYKTPPLADGIFDGWATAIEERAEPA